MVRTLTIPTVLVIALFARDTETTLASFAKLVDMSLSVLLVASDTLDVIVSPLEEDIVAIRTWICLLVDLDEVLLHIRT